MNGFIPSETSEINYFEESADAKYKSLLLTLLALQKLDTDITDVMVTGMTSYVAIDGARGRQEDSIMTLPYRIFRSCIYDASLSSSIIKLLNGSFVT